MIQIYKHENTNFGVNGDITLTPTSSIFKMELNSTCEIELEHPYDNLGRWKYIVTDNVIAGPTPYSEKQLFRIYETEKTLTGIRAYARHIFFDLIDTVLLDVRPTQKTGEEALNILLQGTGYKGHSNLVDLNTAYYIRKNIVEAIAGDDENSFVNRWGGERLYDNFDIYVNSHIGEDNGVRAEFGYNLTEIEEKINLEDTVTRIIPLGYNGIMLDGDKPWVDSSNINKYAKVKAKVVEMQDIKVKENKDDEDGYNTLAEAQNAMKQRCKELFEGGLDLPTCTYSVAMEDLASTTAYKDYKVLETVSIGDTVHCKHIGLGIETKARCVALEWNMISKKYSSLTLGDVTKNFFDEQSDVATRVENILNSNGTVNANKLQGVVNGLNTKLKAQKDIAQKQDVRAILFEDLDPESPTFGATAIGTVGLEIASKRNATNTDWEWNTFITAGLVYADWLVGKLMTVLIQNVDGSFKIDLSKSGGAEYYNNGKIAMRMENNQLKFYDYKDGSYIGSLGSTRNIRKDKPFIELWHGSTSAISLGYENNSTYSPYIRFDKNKILDNEVGEPLQTYENIGMVNYKDLVMYGNDYTKPLGLLAIATGNNNMYICCGAEADNRKVNIGCIENDNMNNLKTWATFSKNDIRLAKELYITTTWQGRTDVFRLSNILDAINTRLTNLENKQE